MNLNGKIAVITGSGYGIGRGIATRLAEDGADIVVSYGHNREEAEITAGMVEKIGKRAEVIQCNVVERKQVDDLIDGTIKAFGRLDIFVNNSGVANQTYLLDLEEETWDWLIDINLKGPYLCSRAAARQMVNQGEGGRIIQIGSVNSTRSVPKRCHYAASKAGLVAMTRVIACELAKYDITCNVVAPGCTRSKMTEVFIKEPEDFQNRTLKSIPMGRIGEPEDVAALVSFLSSKEAGYITGVNIDVDGGLVPAPCWDFV